MIKGVTDKEENIIKNILSNYPYTFFYYGSRVKGDFTKASDLDILIKSDKELPYNVLEELSLKFNESKIPYIVNFSEYISMDKSFYDSIKDSLVKIL